jgi:dihydrofolate synthase/folylpolyglutamate synthase
VEQINAEPEQDPTTFYEAHLAASLLFFAEEGVDFAIIETGLGGRLDATNALSPVVCAITRIDYDHTEILGDDLTDIAREKAGIIKPGVPCVLAPQAPEVSAVIEAQAASVGAPIIAGPAVEAESSGDHFTVRAGQVYGDLRLPLPGRHQRENAAVALGVVEALADFGVRPEPERVRAALETLRWPGRFQVLPGRPTVVLDVAHNAVSARALREDLERLAAEQPEAPAVILVVGMARDKDLAAFAATLFPLAAQVLCTGAHSPRAAAPEALAEAGKRAGVAPRIVATVPEALAEARSLARPQDVICITGSFHVVGEAMEALGVEP